MSEQKGAYRAALTAADTGGGVLSLLNPEGVTLIITKLMIYVSTVATAACTLDGGVGAAATTVYDNLIDGLDVNAATGAFDNHEDKGTNGKTRQLWTSAQYLTISKKTGATAGLVGYAYVEYIRA